MKQKFLVLIIALIIINKAYGQQKQNGYNYHQNYIDSAISYFTKSKTPNGIDSLVFVKGLRMLDSMPADDNSVKRVEKAAENFKGYQKSFFYNQIQTSIFVAFENAHEYRKEIEKGKGIINRYDASPGADDRSLFLSTLSSLRIPFRVSDNLNEGFDFYTTKLKQYLQKNDSSAISICYFVHGGFYFTKGLKDLAIYYYKKSIPYLNINDTANASTNGLIGRNGWTNNTGVVGEMYNSMGDYRNAILYSRLAINSTMPGDANSTSLAYQYKNIAYAKIMLNEPDSVVYLLNEAIKIALAARRYGYAAVCYQVKGIYFLKVNQLDSSVFYLEECKNLMSAHDINPHSTSGVLTPNYYLASVRMKQNSFKDAGELLKAEIPGLVNLREALINEYKLLVEVYLKLGDVKKANETFIQYYTLQEQLKEEERSNRKMSFETEQKITEAESTINNLTIEKKIAALSRNYLLGIAALLFMVALVIYGRFRIIRSQKIIIEREKQRSDLLLLNILPSEVAEELKAKGSADAKQFDDVTVMFTDFKNFTQISEKLSPTELVNEIHTCFEAFDKIISEHNIEKIKTIGDSYMCAGGLPVTNKTHADDMVKAALEIQQFMYKHIEERKKANKEIFEIRIGIHTGPVVAGIVGIKKFAYDIWGDTVNIASRMESSGEAGKVNISGSTYELVKDKFTCSYRGKIQAKNKGEFDMYFVDRMRADEV